MDHFTCNSYNSFVNNTNKIINIYIKKYQTIFIYKIFISLCKQFQHMVLNIRIYKDIYIDLINYLIFSSYITQITGVIFLLNISENHYIEVVNESRFGLLFNNNNLNYNISDFPMIFDKLEKLLLLFSEKL